MKLNKNILTISKKEWKYIGKKAGWNKELNIKEPGKWDGYTKEELIEKRNKIKKRQDKRKKDGKKADPADTKLLKELNFAIRAKNNWGKAD